MAELCGWTPTRAVLERLGPRGISPVHFAAARGWTEALGLLLSPDDHYECRRFLNTSTPRGHTPLLMAMVFRQPETAAFLLRNGELAAISHSGLMGFESSLPHPGGLFGMLSSLPLDDTGGIACIDELCQMLAATGGNPNWERPGVETDLADLLVLEPAFTAWYGDKLVTAVELALYFGDRGYLKSLLDAGARPTLLAMHLAAGLHDVDSFRLMFSHSNCPFKSLSELDAGSYHILDSVLDSGGPKAVFSPLRRLFVSGKPPENACRDMVQFLSTTEGFSLYHTSSSPPPDQDPWWLTITKRTRVSYPSVLDVLLGPNRELLNVSNDPNKHEPPINWTPVVGNDRLSLHLLSLGAEPIKDGPNSTLRKSLGFYSPDNEHLTKKLLEAGCNPNAAQVDATTTLSHSREPQTPFQHAVLTQHFRSASCLYEHGANRDYVTRTLGASKDLTILGHLLYITWSESQNRIRYLFEAHPNAPPPDFIVMPFVGISALQVAAQIAPQNPHQEADARDLVAYLVSRYPGSQYLEYQRFDRSYDRQAKHGQDYPGSPSVGTANDSDPSRRDLAFAYASSNDANPTGSANREYKSAPHRVANGTALLMAAREVNFEAVKVLVDAGADVSAPLGQRKVSSLTGRVSSSYATKELRYASTVLDFALLARDNMDDSPARFPWSLWEDTPETRAYYRAKVDEMIDFLVAKGARCSTAFVGERNTSTLWKTRKEQGNRAALRFLGSTVQTAWEVSKGAFRDEVSRGFGEDWEREKERVRQRREAGLE